MKKHSPLLEEKLNPRAKLWRMYEKVNPDHTQRFPLVSFQYVSALLENSTLPEYQSLLYILYAHSTTHRHSVQTESGEDNAVSL